MLHGCSYTTPRWMRGIDLTPSLARRDHVLSGHFRSDPPPAAMAGASAALRTRSVPPAQPTADRTSGISDLDTSARLSDKWHTVSFHPESPRHGCRGLRMGYGRRCLPAVARHVSTVAMRLDAVRRSGAGMASPVARYVTDPPGTLTIRYTTIWADVPSHAYMCRSPGVYRNTDCVAVDTMCPFLAQARPGPSVPAGYSIPAGAGCCYSVASSQSSMVRDSSLISTASWSARKGRTSSMSISSMTRDTYS